VDRENASLDARRRLHTAAGSFRIDQGPLKSAGQSCWSAVGRRRPVRAKASGVAARPLLRTLWRVHISTHRSNDGREQNEHPAIQVIGLALRRHVDGDIQLHVKATADIWTG